MKKLLLETGVSDEMECPYCKYSEASSNYESRGGYTYRKKEYQTFNWCPVCGWQHYGDEEDEAGEIDIPPKPAQLVEAKKIIKIFKKLKEKAMSIAVDLFMEEEMPTVQQFKEWMIDLIFRTEFN